MKKFRAEINEIETFKKIQKINETKHLWKNKHDQQTLGHTNQKKEGEDSN
jgi:hypothetical protein